jgi:hypothetical protein
MPISYSIHPSRRFVLEVWSDDVTTRHVKSLWKAYLADREVLAIRKTLADMRRGNPIVTGSEMWDLILEIALPGLKGRDWKTAIVVATRIQYGLARQFQVFAEPYNKHVAIFEAYDEAARWIEGQ